MVMLLKTDSFPCWPCSVARPYRSCFTSQDTWHVERNIDLMGCPSGHFPSSIYGEILFVNLRGHLHHILTSAQVFGFCGELSEGDVALCVFPSV